MIRYKLQPEGNIEMDKRSKGKDFLIGIGYGALLTLIIILVMEILAPTVLHLPKVNFPRVSFIDLILLLSLTGFSLGIGVSLKLSEGKSNLFAGIVLLTFPIILLVLLLGGGSYSGDNIIKDLKTTLFSLSFLVGLVIGVHSGAWIKLGFRKIESVEEALEIIQEKL